MKRFVVSMLCLSVFFIGLGNLVESVGARFKSDERALELVRLARQAVGGEANIRTVSGMSITGRATKNFEFDGVAKTEQGDWELNLQLPNKFSRMIKMNVAEGLPGQRTESIDRDVVIVRKEKALAKKSDGELPREGIFVIEQNDDKVLERTQVPNGESDKKVLVDEVLRGNFEKMQHNDLFRTTLALLLTTPQETETEFLFAGEGSVDGSSCHIVEARTGGQSVKLYLDKSTNLVRMMSYTDAKPMMFFRIKQKAGEAEDTGALKTFERRLEAPQTAEFQIKFSDYRSVNGLQLPFRWTQTIGGQLDETIEISGYEINPANIAEKFTRPQRFMIQLREKQ